tara:strand:+ start:653 stop:814 length:162 start_codon:yes stop_codon:yes gene_type:complete
MTSLAEDIKRISISLEEAMSEKDWIIVEQMIEQLDDVYMELDRQETGAEYDYE